MHGIVGDAVASTFLDTHTTRWLLGEVCGWTSLNARSSVLSIAVIDNAGGESIQFDRIIISSAVETSVNF